MAIKCQRCGETLRRAILLALLEDAGAKVYPPSTACPGSENGQHEWSGDESLREESHGT